MKLLSLIDFSLIMILASNSNCQDWNITVPSNISVEKGLDAIISCKFTYPPEEKIDEVYWKKHGTQINIIDNDKNAFVYHPNDTFVLENYRMRTTLIGDINNGNCSLRIQNVTSNDQGLYVRLVTEKEQYSFIKHTVSISVTESGVTSGPLPNVDMTTMNLTLLLVAIIVPISVLVIIILIIGIYCSIKHKRSQSFTREESGYYANFSRPTSNQVQRESSCKIIENKEPSVMKGIDEPVYVNTETCTHQGLDHSDSIYANVDYSK